MRNERRTQHATSLLVGVHRFFVSLKDDTEKEKSASSASSADEKSRKFSLTG